MTGPPVVVLRRALRPAELLVLAELVEAPGYKKISVTLHCAQRTVRQHVANIAAQLPAEFFPSAGTKDRVVFYAQRQHALAELAKARVAAA